MGSISQLLSTARDALSAQSYGLNVTGQNLANVNTPGYVRREAVLQTRAYGTQTTGTVEAVGLRRVTDQFLERRQYEATGLSSAAKEHDQRLSSLRRVHYGRRHRLARRSGGVHSFLQLRHPRT